MSFGILEEIIATIIAVTLSTTVVILTKDVFTRRIIKAEQKEVQEEVERCLNRFDEADPSDVLQLMRRNVAELREYYVINKQQARNAFTSAIIVSILGFLIFACGVIVSYLSDTVSNTVLYSTISGAIVEVISGLFFWLYSQSLKQINLFHESLRNTEKVLTSVKLAERVTDSNRDAVYSYIIQCIFKSEHSPSTENNDEELEEEEEVI